MHTNGGDRWIVWDTIEDKEADSFRSQAKARQMVTVGNLFIPGRFVMKMWNEVTHEISTNTSSAVS